MLLSNHVLSYVSNFIGLIGVILVLVAYFMLQVGLWAYHNLWFCLLNILGSIFILISLYYHWNTASVVIEVVWLIISFYGLFKGKLGTVKDIKK